MKDKMRNKNSRVEKKNKYDESAIASFILSIIGLSFWPILIIPAVIGIVSLIKISKNKLRGKSLAITAIVISILGIIAGLYFRQLRGGI